jgi:hypothetical protein
LLKKGCVIVVVVVRGMTYMGHDNMGEEGENNKRRVRMVVVAVMVVQQEGFAKGMIKP